MDKIKELWASLVEKVGYDTAIAVAVVAALFVFVDPVIAVVAGVGYWFYRSGKLGKIVAKFKKSPDA